MKTSRLLQKIRQKYFGGVAPVIVLLNKADQMAPAQEPVDQPPQAGKTSACSAAGRCDEPRGKPDAAGGLRSVPTWIGRRTSKR